MRKKNRLRMLEVRHSGQRHSKRPLRKRYKRADVGDNAAGGLVHRIFNKHAEIGGHQFIPAACRVELVTKRTELFDERKLYEMVHIFGRRGVQP